MLCQSMHLSSCGKKSWYISGELLRRAWQLLTLSMSPWSLWIPWSSHAGRRRWNRGLTVPLHWSTVKGRSPLSSSAIWCLWLLKPRSLSRSQLLPILVKLEKRGRGRRGAKEGKRSLSRSYHTRSAWSRRRGCPQADSCSSTQLQFNPLQRSLPLRALR